jgi:hypothetical protein
MESEAPQVQVSKPPLEPAPEPETQGDDRVQLYIIGGGVLILVLIIAAIVLMALNPGATEVIRDIAIVFVAVETLLIGIAVLVLTVQVYDLVKVLREEIIPLLQSVNQTASTVRGTTEFVSENMVSPVIRVASLAAGARRVAGNLKHVISSARPRSKE